VCVLLKACWNLEQRLMHVQTCISRARRLVTLVQSKAHLAIGHLQQLQARPLPRSRAVASYVQGVKRSSTCCIAGRHQRGMGGRPGLARGILVCSELEAWLALHALCQSAPPCEVPCADFTLGDAGSAACWEGINALRARPSYTHTVLCLASICAPGRSLRVAMRQQAR